MQYKIHTLKNGLRVIFAPMKDTQTATVLILVGTGSRYETKKTNGLAHFLEHMFFKGTQKRPTTLAIAEELDAVGGEYNAYTSKDHTGYWAKVDSKHVGVALDVVSDIFLNAKIEQKEINRERGPILQELNMYEDMPIRHIGDLFELLLFGDHPLGREILGTRENINGVMRKDFIDYLDQYYVASNTVVAVSGNFSQKDVLKKITQDFVDMRVGEKPSFVSYDSDYVPSSPVYVQDKKTDQTQLMVGVGAYGFRSKNRYALAVLSAILGGGMSSRLFIAVRERRGLAYNVRTMTEAYADAGCLVTQAGVEHDNVEEALKIILREYRRTRREKVLRKELSKAKDFLKGRLVLGLESSDEVATFFAEQEVVKGKITPLSEHLENIDKVRAADVHRVANEIFQTDRLRLAIIGPHGDGQQLRGLLKV